MFPQDKLCHDGWDGYFNNDPCLSSNTHPYVMINSDDKNVYYWCEKHAAKRSKAKRLTPEEVIILEVMGS
jgi:hypothetical protein